jgi:hypothetical protein
VRGDRTSDCRLQSAADPLNNTAGANTMADAFDLHTAVTHASPADIAGWPITVTITTVNEDPRGGFELLFDRILPESWKWPSNPAVPSDNFQFTVWSFVQVGGKWHGAGFVQMWQGRSMKTGALPAIFAINDGAPGYVNWWGDVRRLWGEMSDYVPRPGDHVGFLVSAGNGRLVQGVTSVRERSNVVLVTLTASDVLSVSTGAAVPPGPEPVNLTPTAPKLASLEKLIKEAENQSRLLATTLDELKRAIAALR